MQISYQAVVKFQFFLKISSESSSVFSRMKTLRVDPASPRLHCRANSVERRKREKERFTRSERFYLLEEMSQIEFSFALASDSYRSAATHVASHSRCRSRRFSIIGLTPTSLFSLQLIPRDPDHRDANLSVTSIYQFARRLDVTSGVIGEFYSDDVPLSRLSILLHDDRSLIFLLIFRIDLGSIGRPGSGDPLQGKARSPRIFLKVSNERAKFSRHLENSGRETITYRDPMRTVG